MHVVYVSGGSVLKCTPTMTFVPILSLGGIVLFSRLFARHCCSADAPWLAL